MEIFKSLPVMKSFFPLFHHRLRRKNSNELEDLAKAHNQMTKIKHVFFLYAGINIQKLFVMFKLLASVLKCDELASRTSKESADFEIINNQLTSKM